MVASQRLGAIHVAEQSVGRLVEAGRLGAVEATDRNVASLAVLGRKGVSLRQHIGDAAGLDPAMGGAAPPIVKVIR